MALVAIATSWWLYQCMRCGMTWGPYFHERKEEPMCYLCEVLALPVQEEGLLVVLRQPKGV